MKTMNKKGLGPLLLIPLILVLVLVVGAIILFVSSVKFLLVGIVLITASFVVLTASAKQSFTKGNVTLFLILMSMGILFLFANSFGFLQNAAITGNVFVKPQWAKLICLNDGTYSQSGDILVPKAGKWIDCGPPGGSENTEECRVVMKTSDADTWLSQNSVRVIYKKCVQGSNCNTPEQVMTVTRGEADRIIDYVADGSTMFVRIESSTLRINEEGTVYKKFLQFKLFDDYGGRKLVNAQNCNIPVSSVINNILEGETTEDGDGGTCTTGKFARGEWCNYVHDWVYGPANNVYTHSQYGEVYCSAKELYDIVEVTTESGQIKKVAPEYVGTKPDGERLLGMGTRLARVECCPNEPNCGEDFKWKTIGGGKSCFSDTQCLNGGDWFYHSSGKRIREFCNANSKCELTQPQTVQCARDSDCQPGYICQATTDPWQCVQISNPGDPDKDPTACQAKAAKYPWLGYEFVEEKTESCGLNPLCHLGITKPKITTASSCVATFALYWFMAGAIIFLGIAIVVILRLLPSGKKSSGKKRR